MGQFVSKVSENCSNLISGKRKRKRDDSSDTDKEANSSAELCSIKRKRVMATTEYIYEELFKKEKSSDIAVMALGHVWHLHKIYLSQSPYFSSMFNGSWKESLQNLIHIKILDERITFDSLNAVFGCLYSDIIEIDPKLVVNILATATLFHLDGVIDKCAEVMIETIHDENAVQIYEAACEYACLSVKKIAFKWLETNLLWLFNKNMKLLANISIELMTKLVSSPDLYVMQTEYSLYTLLRAWICLRTCPKDQLEKYIEKMDAALKMEQRPENPNAKCINERLLARFPKQNAENCSFLLTPEGQKYLKPFLALRTQYLTNHQMDLEVIFKDQLIPSKWLHSHVMNHWNFLLAVDHQSEEGPGDVTREEFEANCMRCGRVLMEPGYQKWRWTGFNYGLDLILIADSRTLTIRRHHRNEHERLLSLQTRRQFKIVASVTSINKLYQPRFTQKTEMLSLSLERNEERVIMEMDTQLKHPLLISIHVLVIKPPTQNIKDCSNSCDDTFNTTTPISEIGGALTNDCDKDLAEDAAPPANVGEDENLLDSETEQSSAAQSVSISNLEFY